MPVNYQEGKIYKIYNTSNDDIYIGSTTQKLCERMRNHRNAHKSKHHFNLPIYKAFREHGVENFFIELIEKCPCNDKDEIMKTEGSYIRTLESSLSARIAGRTKKELLEDKRDILSQKSKDYRENNREKLLQRHRDYYQQNREVRTEYSAKYKNERKEERHEYNKQYRESHKEQIFKTRQQYREANKERIATHKTEEIKCECGCMISRGNLAPHRRSKKHEQLLQTTE